MLSQVLLKKRPSDSIHWQNIQLYLWGVCFNALGVWIELRGGRAWLSTLGGGGAPWAWWAIEALHMASFEDSATILPRASWCSAMLKPFPSTLIARRRGQSASGRPTYVFQQAHPSAHETTP